EAHRGPAGEWLAAALADPGQRVLVGTIGDEVTGYAVGRLEALADGRVLGVIDELFVEPEARHVGVGAALAGALVEWCGAAGCAGVDAQALPGNRAAKNFFEAAGFSARLIVMHHRFEG
ncbi:MAG: GNAT family N-acetyltransferase, partial [Acidimicrobiales bacterium]